MREVSVELPDKVVAFIEGKRCMMEPALGRKILWKEFASDYIAGIIESRMRGK